MTALSNSGYQLNEVLPKIEESKQRPEQKKDMEIVETKKALFYNLEVIKVACKKKKTKKKIRGDFSDIFQKMGFSSKEEKEE